MTVPYIKILTENLVSGMYGSAVQLEVTNSEGTALDISSYTTITVVTKSPDSQRTLEFTGVVDTGGTGLLNFVPSSGNTFDRPGIWSGQVEFETISSLMPTPLFDVQIEPRLGT